MNEKITEKEMLARFRTGEILLSPLVIRHSEFQIGRGALGKRVDALVEATLPHEGGRFRFIVEAKSRPTLEAIHAAASQAKEATGPDEWPMIQVPFLAPDRLKYLEDAQISGVDLCGNGVVIVPHRLLLVRSGQPNLYRDSRPLNNPFRGRSAMVARMLIAEPSSLPTLKDLAASIGEAGIDLSLSQASKAVHALEEELFIVKYAGMIKLIERERLLGKLGSEWRPPIFTARQAFRLTPDDMKWGSRLSSDPALRWSVTGESSASRHSAFSQGGPKRIAVSDLAKAAELLGGTPERVSNFADVELLETEEPGYFFQTITDAKGVRWASRLQTWLELQAGDARQRDAARDIYGQVFWGNSNDVR